MPPQLVDVRPPRNARVMWKQVAVDPATGRAWSLFDGSTPYLPGSTLWEPAAEEHGGGLYCFASLERACVNRDDQLLPPHAAMRHWPRAIARVQAWNDEGPPLVYGLKHAFSFMHVLDLLAMPLTWTPQSSDVDRRRPTGSASPAASQGAISLARRQAATLRLELEVADMERHVALARRTLTV